MEESSRTLVAQFCLCLEPAEPNSRSISKQSASAASRVSTLTGWHEPKLVRIRVAASPLYSIQLVYSKKLGCVKFPRGQREPRRGITQPIFAFYTSTLLHSAMELVLSPFPVGSFAFPLRQSDVRLRVRSNAAITGGRSQRDTHKPEPSGGHTLKNA